MTKDYDQGVIDITMFRDLDDRSNFSFDTVFIILGHDH